MITNILPFFLWFTVYMSKRLLRMYVSKYVFVRAADLAGYRLSLRQDAVVLFQKCTKLSHCQQWALYRRWRQ